MNIYTFEKVENKIVISIPVDDLVLLLENDETYQDSSFLVEDRDAFADAIITSLQEVPSPSNSEFSMFEELIDAALEQLVSYDNGSLKFSDDDDE